MSRNYRLLLQVLEKWPVDKVKAHRDLGLKLRELSSDCFPKGCIFPGTEDENFKMLSSLDRIANNMYGRKYESSLRPNLYAAGLELAHCKRLIKKLYETGVLGTEDIKSIEAKQEEKV